MIWILFILNAIGVIDQLDKIIPQNYDNNIINTYSSQSNKILLNSSDNIKNMSPEELEKMKEDYKIVIRTNYYDEAFIKYIKIFLNFLLC